MTNKFIATISNEALLFANSHCMNNNHSELYTNKLAELLIDAVIKVLESERDYYKIPWNYATDDHYFRKEGKIEALDEAISLINNILE